MSDILVLPDLYTGSALTRISTLLKKTIDESDLEIKVIDFTGPLTTIKSGDLDDPEIFFNHNVSTLLNLKNEVKNGDNILFADFFQPGLGMLQYYLDGCNKKVKYGALFHGASILNCDYYQEKKWMNNFELGMLNLMDKVYVPSKYAANNLNKFIKNSKVRVFPYGFDPSEYACNLNANTKEFDVIIPHRWSWEKNPQFWGKLVKAMPKTQFAISGFGAESTDYKLKEIFKSTISQKNITDLGVTDEKNHIYDLSRAKIVLATQDLFGYSYREAMACGCIPVVIDDFCYPEFVPKTHRFQNLEGATQLIDKFVKTYPDKYLKPKKYSFGEILEDFYGKNMSMH